MVNFTVTGDHHPIQHQLDAFVQERLLGEKVDTLDRITTGTALIERLDSLRSQLIEQARYEGASWQDIADALGTSRQAAWKAHRID